MLPSQPERPSFASVGVLVDSGTKANPGRHPFDRQSSRYRRRHREIDGEKGVAAGPPGPRNGGWDSCSTWPASGRLGASHSWNRVTLCNDHAEWYEFR